MSQAIGRIIVERVLGAPAVALPEKATTGSACFDLRAAEAVKLESGRIVLVRTGLRLKAPEGTFLEVRPRSGLGAKGVLMVNAPGTIDSDYTGEVKVPLTFLLAGTHPIEVGDRIAQVRLVEEHPSEFAEGPIATSTSRTGGFGSTGR
ncbi:MAG: dUTP diphosphatase [Thermoplasmata archaeon]|nr:dUTP diphosphatase [Thermoplasmata archaeon]